MTTVDTSVDCAIEAATFARECVECGWTSKPYSTATAAKTALTRHWKECIVSKPTTEPSIDIEPTPREEYCDDPTPLMVSPSNHKPRFTSWTRQPTPYENAIVVLNMTPDCTALSTFAARVGKHKEQFTPSELTRLRQAYQARRAYLTRS